MENGVEKDTRAGRVKSVFGRQLRFDLKEGFPLLTTKKVFTKGIIHELLWFLQRPMNGHGSMNIEYLVRNGVHIWDDDAYRWFNEWIDKHIVKPVNMDYEFVVCVNDDEIEKTPAFEYWMYNEVKKNDLGWLINISKEEFLELVYQKVELRVYNGMLYEVYRFGDLGPIYGKQWRSFGAALNTYYGVDQIQNIIETLKKNPNDRRMLCVAYNPAAIDQMALPPCHVMFQFYTRELEPGKYGLSCMFNMRSNDYMCGTPFNWPQYALLTHMIANIVGMIPDELVYCVGDCHVYLNHMDGVKEQLQRNGSDEVPMLKINREVESIEDFRYDDFEIVNYNPDPPIKFQLNVG
jgi:thymidylate synthase